MISEPLIPLEDKIIVISFRRHMQINRIIDT